MSGASGAGTAADEVEERIALALAALAEVTDPTDVGPLIDVGSPAEGVADLRFACTLGGYPGWAWTVSTARIAGAAPTVLEVELLPMEGALLAPAWVPWTERLAEWRRTHPADEDDEDADEDVDDDLGDDEVADQLDDDELDDELGDVDDSDVDDADEDRPEDEEDLDEGDLDEGDLDEGDLDEGDLDEDDLDEDDPDADDGGRDEGLREV